MERLREFKYSIETIECIFTSWGIAVYGVIFIKRRPRMGERVGGGN